MTADQHLRQSLEVRLGELKRAVTELEALLDATDSNGNGNGDVNDNGVAMAPALATGAVPTMPRHPYRRGVRSSRPGRDGRAPYGSVRAQIMETILANPGITAPEIAELTGLVRSNVAATIYRLKAKGELEPYGEGVRIPLSRVATH